VNKVTWQKRVAVWRSRLYLYPAPEPLPRTPLFWVALGLVTMMVATFIMGLFVITIFMGVMKTVLHFEYGPLVAFTMLGFLIMLLLEGIFIRLLFRPLKRRDSEPRNTFQNNRGSTKELEAQSRMPLEPVASVTEHTTRAFDPVYSERK